jgi:hypothetical protein
MSKLKILAVLLLVCILAACTDNSEVDRLQQELDELREQINATTEDTTDETTSAPVTTESPETVLTVEEDSSAEPPTVATEFPVTTPEPPVNEQIAVNRRASIINTLPTLFETPSVGGRRITDVPYDTIAMVYYQIPIADSSDMRFRYVYGDYWINIGFTRPDTGEYVRGYTGINAVSEWAD